MSQLFPIRENREIDIDALNPAIRRIQEMRHESSRIRAQLRTAMRTERTTAASLKYAVDQRTSSGVNIGVSHYETIHIHAVEEVRRLLQKQRNLEAETRALEHHLGDEYQQVVNYLDETEGLNWSRHHYYYPRRRRHVRRHHPPRGAR
jgi:hypothetical protein